MEAFVVAINNVFAGVKLVSHNGEERRLRLLDSMVLSRIFDPKRDEVTGEWRKLHNEVLNDPYFLNKYYSSDKIKNNNLGERRDECSVLVGNLRERDHLEDPDVDGRIILR